MRISEGQIFGKHHVASLTTNVNIITVYNLTNIVWRHLLYCRFEFIIQVNHFPDWYRACSSQLHHLLTLRGAKPSCCQLCFSNFDPSLFIVKFFLDTLDNRMFSCWIIIRDILQNNSTLALSLGHVCPSNASTNCNGKATMLSS